MTRNWTFGQKIGAGFAVTVALALVIASVAVYSLRSVIAEKDRVIEVDARLLTDVESLARLREAKASGARGFLLAREERYMDDMKTAREEFARVVTDLRQSMPYEEGRRLVDAIARGDADYQVALESVIALRRTDAALDTVVRAFEDQVRPARSRLDEGLQAFVAWQSRQLEDAKQAATEAASRVIALMICIGIGVVVLASLMAITLTRSLASQIGSAVGHVQSSSTELQAAANQQASGAREQATAMAEISTTISELLATSRQMAEGAQRVAQVAEQTAEAARSGEGTVGKAHESVGGIRRQVDLVVSHMLDLGKKSQQIGSIVEIVAELAEQTNILAINATIEAAGAGEAGKRFSVVADEIRKLADRVSGSAKEIRTLVEDVRAAVNTTVMATETGSKAVDAGTRQFGEVASSLRQISGLVGTTTEASREIELSTKQQATAVEQVNVAITDIAQATKETEASSAQTLQTASQLAALSKDLLRLVRPQLAA